MKAKKILTQREILNLLHKHQNVLDRYGVKRIGLFGSYSKGKQQQRSDVDFIVEFQEPTFENFIGLVEYLEKILDKKVDVLTPESIQEDREKILKELWAIKNFKSLRGTLTPDGKTGNFKRDYISTFYIENGRFKSAKGVTV